MSLISILRVNSMYRLLKSLLNVHFVVKQECIDIEVQKNLSKI